MQVPRAFCATLGIGMGLTATACDFRPAWQRESMGQVYFDSTGTYVDAGVSVRFQPDIEPLRRSSLGPDTARSYHLFAARCGSCHAVPDPDMNTGEHWSFLMRRMQDKTRRAGVIPISDAESDSILTFLRKHAAPAGGGRRDGG
ncbi:MAG: hypothetical protein RLN75_06730 [Longimicrobiales bacterium]